MLKKIMIKNYRIFESFQLEFNPTMNILVGGNDAGKSTILEAIELALTGRVRGRALTQELSPHLFHRQTVTKYLLSLKSGQFVPPPEIIIDLFLDVEIPGPEAPLLVGMNNLLQEDAPGIRLRLALNPDFLPEYEQYIKGQIPVRLVPTEYYRTEWLGFSGNSITWRSIPATASLVDASNIQLQSGIDFYRKNIISEHLQPAQRVELARAYRSLREDFASDPAIVKINQTLGGMSGDLSDQALTLNIDVSQRSSWENGVIPHLNDLPVQYSGKGEQSALKILLDINRNAEKTHVVLVEEPENHQSFGNLGRLVKKIGDKCEAKQVFITTHSSYVLNKLGIENLILLSTDGGFRLDHLPADTKDYFRKLSGYDTLRLVLAKRSILVEGPSDELIVQRAFKDKYGCLPLEMGVDVIDARSITFKRFLEIAVHLKGNRVSVITDNDGVDANVVKAKYDPYTTVNSNITVHVGEDTAYRTLEPQLLKANGLEVMNRVLGQQFRTEERLLTYMRNDKTRCALAVFDSAYTIKMPKYITDAIA